MVPEKCLATRGNHSPLALALDLYGVPVSARGVHCGRCGLDASSAPLLTAADAVGVAQAEMVCAPGRYRYRLRALLVQG